MSPLARSLKLFSCAVEDTWLKSEDGTWGDRGLCGGAETKLAGLLSFAGALARKRGIVVGQLPRSMPPPATKAETYLTACPNSMAEEKGHHV
jgi:hypothetical protein